jgi:polysaccharide biosynthesis protein PslH
MKCLFISSRDVNLKSQGAPQCTNRNYLTFCELFGKENVIVFDVDEQIKGSWKLKIFKRLNILRGYYWGLSNGKINHIKQVASSCELVFIDSSLYGIVAFHLKKSNYTGKIICHFHNVEYFLRIEKAKRNPFSIWEVFVVLRNERAAIGFSDQIIALNQRDSSELAKLYGSSISTRIIPISMLDSHPGHSEGLISSPPTLLFFGSSHYANIHGIRWFIKNVLDKVDVKLQVVGNGMEVLRNEFEGPKLEILGFVPDLSKIIIDADIIISPVFKGSGMKVKTCEALMYGKNIIGTRESFEGYEVDPALAGAQCDTVDQFINTLNSSGLNKLSRYNAYTRKCFEEKYSFHATLRQFKEIIN